MLRTTRIFLFLFTSILLLSTSCYVYASKSQENDSQPDDNPAINEKDVVVLTGKNFSDFVTRNQFVLVDFYASWCLWSRKLAPEYSAAATLMKGEAILAKVDASEETALTWKYHIDGYPTLYLFVDGVPKVRYYGHRQRDAIATWMRQKIGFAVQTVTTKEEAESFLTNSVVVMGFFDCLAGPHTEELAAASKLHADVNFYQTANADIARLFHINPQIKRRPALVLLKWEIENHTVIDFGGQFNRSEISDFVCMNKVASVITFTTEDASRIFENPMKQLWLFAPKYSWDLIFTFLETAKTFKGKLLFVYVETLNNPVGLAAELAYQFGFTDGASGIIAYMANGHSRHVYLGELTLSGIKSFAVEFLEDKLPSQSVPKFKDTNAASIGFTSL